MRLYLTSQDFGDHPEVLVSLAGDRRHFAVIANARDDDPHGRMRAVQREIDGLERLGLTAVELDLRAWFDAPDGLADHLHQFGVVWTMGGNSFVLRRAFRQSGLDEALITALQRDALVYAGSSAGAVMAPPTLRGIELMDEPDVVPSGYDPAVVWDGLDLVPFLIVPHVECGDPGCEAPTRCVEHLISHHIPFVALHDGDTVVVDADGWRVDARAGATHAR